MVRLNEMEQWVADTALGYLYADDANPDVGWGLMEHTAIDYAFKDLKKTATLFAGGYDFALLQIDRNNVEAFVAEKRKR